MEGKEMFIVFLFEFRRFGELHIVLNKKQLRKFGVGIIKKQGDKSYY